MNTKLIKQAIEGITLKKANKEQLEACTDLNLKIAIQKWHEEAFIEESFLAQIETKYVEARIHNVVVSSNGMAEDGNYYIPSYSVEGFYKCSELEAKTYTLLTNRTESAYANVARIERNLIQKHELKISPVEVVAVADILKASVTENLLELAA